MVRQNVYSGTVWEPRVAYCRAKRVGSVVLVSGTVAVDEHGRVVGSNTYEQMRYALQKIERALRELGSGLNDVVRTRTYLTDMSNFDEFARAHREAFTNIDPVATCVEVSGLVSPEVLVEVEVDAIADA